MRSQEQRGGDVIFVLIVAIIFAAVMRSRENVDESIEPSPPSVPTAMFEDVRVQLPADLHETVSGFIRTGRLKIGKAGIDSTQVREIHVRPGAIVFEPPLRVSYDTALMTAGSTVKEIRIDADGEIEVDVVNSPIDLKFTK